MVRTPASAQAAISQPGEPIKRDDSADVIKIPDPIIDPTTIIVASSRLRPRTSFASASLLIASGYSWAGRTCQGKLFVGVALRGHPIFPDHSRESEWGG